MLMNYLYDVQTLVINRISFYLHIKTFTIYFNKLCDKRRKMFQ